MHDSHLALSLNVPFDREEDVKGYLLVNYEVEGFEESPGGGIIVYLKSIVIDREDLSTSLKHLGAKLVNVETIEDQDWNAAWEASIEPVPVTEELVMTPSWKIAEARALDPKHLLVIDPKMSFGTGHHETTRLCLHLLEEVDCTDKTILDVGTGTGALAMYTLQRGATYAIGIDTDEWSFQNAQENRQLNQFAEDTFDIRFGDLASTIAKDEIFDLITANIHRNVLLPLAQELYKHIAVSGKLILSGILSYDAEEVRQAYLDTGFSFVKSMQEHEWVALLFVR